MPERPDLEHQVPILARRLIGTTITGVRVRKPVVLRAPLGLEVLVGRTVRDVRRMGHFVVVTFDGEWDMVVHLMLAGRFSFARAGQKDSGDLAVVWGLLGGGEGDEELRYRDDVQMGKVYLVPAGDLASVPGLLPVGIDVLGPAFTRERLGELVKKRREQVKVFLKDKNTIDSFGSAYADETLWEAGLHPKATTSTLSREQLDRLHAAMVKVLREAREEIARRDPPLDEKVRDFLAVRNRGGEPCPRCGAKIRSAGVHGHDAFFCPVCQPDLGGKGALDWRSIGK
ncbi:MAG: DNA-formamidopyrimidine glycosylase family protein [Pseudomonadota bacterium]|nr:DNA-formamidopyrimidine glycosylase family protein [Pseudomonadota bacterium]